MSEEKKVPKLATYIGRRLNTKGKLSHFWFLEGGSAANAGGYKINLAPSKIGEVWELTVNEAGSVFKAPPPRQHGWHSDAEDIRSWAARDTAHVNEFTFKRVETKLKARESQFKEALRPLRALMYSLNVHDERAAFVNAVCAELWRRPTK